jgi:hypothetical protein
MSATALPIDEGADRDEPPFAPALVEDMLRLLGKTARARALYLHNNPTYLRTLEQLRGSFAPIWAETSSLVLVVGETELRWEGRSVLAEADKSSEALPWLLYKDGIRELHLLPGFEEEELQVFLDLVLAVRRVGNVEDDLITLLWERDLAFLRYRFVDVADDGVFAFERKQQAGPSEAVTASALQTTVQQQAGLVRIDDYQGTLHFLNAQEPPPRSASTSRSIACFASGCCRRCGPNRNPLSTPSTPMCRTICAKRSSRRRWSVGWMPSLGSCRLRRS